MPFVKLKPLETPVARNNWSFETCFKEHNLQKKNKIYRGDQFLSNYIFCSILFEKIVYLDITKEILSSKWGNVVQHTLRRYAKKITVESTSVKKFDFFRKKRKTFENISLTMKYVSKFPFFWSSTDKRRSKNSKTNAFSMYLPKS